MGKEGTVAVALLSGGLDSTLAAKMIILQGIKIIGVNIFSPFFQSKYAIQFAEGLGIDLHLIEVGKEYLNLLKNPKFGFGKNLNPCVDCHIYMMKQAGRYMEEIKASFILTGEVLVHGRNLNPEQH